MAENKILVIDLVGLTRDVLKDMPRVRTAMGPSGRINGLIPPLPAVTCTCQATLTTGSLPAQHGIVSNGWLFRDTAEVRFWLRSDWLVQGEKIWQAARQACKDLRVANLFWRFCTHSGCDITVTERPAYWADGRKSPDVYTHPGTLRNKLVEKLGPFPLFRFWGPATSIDSTRWIADATLHVLRSADPHLTLTYLPHLDYDLQKYGPGSEAARQAIREVDSVAAALIDEARALGRDILILSEYGIVPVERPVFLNRELRKAGFVAVQTAENGELLEPGACRALAVCSHQVAHVYVADPSDVTGVQRLLQSVDGVEQVLDRQHQKDAGLDHPRAGELIAVAARDAWLAYPYWLDDRNAPDFARCVAIHDKPGHDPLEMFLGPGGKRHVIKRVVQSRLGLRVPFDVTSLNAALIRGSHGRLPDNFDEGPVMLTTWEHAAPDPLPMTDFKSLVLQRLI
jgi:predicted AlkP superfamily pyrophosphatase or phosphodiesterase